jgi:hypothetical protein
MSAFSGGRSMEALAGEEAVPTETCVAGGETLHAERREPVFCRLRMPVLPD